MEEVKLLRWREPLGRRAAEAGFRRQRGGREWGFWHHHFVRAGLLRRIFLRDSLADDCRISEVIYELRVARRSGGRRLPPKVQRMLFPGVALVPTTPMLQLGEPLVRGRLTRNGLAALQAAGCEIPDYESTETEVAY